MGRKDTLLGRRGSFRSGKHSGESHLAIGYCCRLSMWILSFLIHFVINIVDVSVHFHITVPFPVNCSNLNPLSLPLVLPAGVEGGWAGRGSSSVVLAGILNWRMPFPLQKALIRSRQTTSTTYYTSTEQVTCHKRRPGWSSRTYLSQTPADWASFPRGPACAMGWHSG